MQYFSEKTWDAMQLPSLVCSLIVHFYCQFLNPGITLAFFMQFGKTPSENDKLHKIDNGTAIMSLASFIKQADKPSSQGDLLRLNKLIS